MMIRVRATLAPRLVGASRVGGARYLCAKPPKDVASSSGASADDAVATEVKRDERGIEVKKWGTSLELPEVSIGLVLSDKDNKFARDQGAVEAIVAKVRDQVQKKLKASELIVFLDGDIVSSHLLENQNKPFSKNALKMTSRANDWMFASKHRNGNARVFNKMMRGTRAEFALLLREEDFLHRDGMSSGNSGSDSSRDGNSL